MLEWVRNGMWEGVVLDQVEKRCEKSYSIDRLRGVHLPACLPTTRKKKKETMESDAERRNIAPPNRSLHDSSLKIHLYTPTHALYNIISFINLTRTSQSSSKSLSLADPPVQAPVSPAQPSMLPAVAARQFPVHVVSAMFPSFLLGRPQSAS